MDRGLGIEKRQENMMDRRIEGKDIRIKKWGWGQKVSRTEGCRLGGMKASRTKAGRTECWTDGRMGG